MRKFMGFEEQKILQCESFLHLESPGFMYGFSRQQLGFYRAKEGDKVHIADMKRGLRRVNRKKYLM